MTLTCYERKRKLGHGAVTRIAGQTGYSMGRVSEIIRTEETGQRSPDDAVEIAVATELGMPMNEVFPPRPQAKRARSVVPSPQE